MPKAYSYLRFSTPEQSKGDSYRRQTELAIEACKRFGLELDNSLTFQDLGVSGYKGENLTKGALGDFIRLVDSGIIERGSWLILESLDRLSRDNVQKALLNYLSLIDKGITIYTCQDKMIHKIETDSTTSMMNMTMSLMVMSRANEESETKSKRLKASWQNKRDKAVPMTSICPAWLKIEEGQYKIIPEKVEIVQNIFSMNRAGYGSNKITRTLNEQGVINISYGTSKRSGKNWHESYIKKILGNPAVIGEFQPNQIINGKREPTGEPISDYFPAIIEKEEFYQLKAIRQSKNIPKSGRKGEHFSNLFNGLVFCTCGATMRYSNKGNNLTYLQCSSNKLNTGCSNKPIRYNLAESSILFWLSNMQTSSLFQLNEHYEHNDRAIRSKVAALEGENKRDEQSLNNLLAIIEQGNAPRTILDRITKLEQKILERNAKKKIIEDQFSIRPTESSIDEFEAVFYVCQMNNKSEKLFVRRQKYNQQLKTIISKIIIGEESGKRTIEVTLVNGKSIKFLNPESKQQKFIKLFRMEQNNSVGKHLPSTDNMIKDIKSGLERINAFARKIHSNPQILHTLYSIQEEAQNKVAEDRRIVHSAKHPKNSTH